MMVDAFLFLFLGIFLSHFFINSSHNGELKYFRMQFWVPYTVKFIYDSRYVRARIRDSLKDFLSHPSPQDEYTRILLSNYLKMIRIEIMGGLLLRSTGILIYHIAP